MVIDTNIQQKIVRSLANRERTISALVIALLQEGYLPNNIKYNILNWIDMLLACYNNQAVLTEDQQQSLINVTNKVLSL